MKESALKITKETGSFKCEADCQCENGSTFLGTPRWYSINTAPGKGASMKDAYDSLWGNCKKSCEARGTKAMDVAVKGTGNHYLSQTIFPEEMKRICVQIRE